MTLDLSLDHLLPAIAGFVVSGLVGLIAWLVKSLLKARAEKVKEAKRGLEKHKDQTAEALDRLVQKLEQLRDSVHGMDRSWVERTAKLEARLEILAAGVQGYITSVSKLEGRVDDMVTQGTQHIATIAHMSRQFEAVFKIIDARKRASDEAKNHLATTKG